MQSLKSPYILYNQQSMGSTLHNNLLFITRAAFLVGQRDHAAIPGAASLFRHFHVLLLHRFSRPLAGRTAMYAENPKGGHEKSRLLFLKRISGSSRSDM